MAPCLQRGDRVMAAHAHGFRAHALCCVLLLAACRVYDGDALSQASGDTNHSVSAVEACGLADAACPGAGCAEECNAIDDDCDGMIDEGAADSCQLSHGGAVCREGHCELARCTDGFRDCDGDADNGCEVEPDAIEHCGQCQRRCEITHASARCEAGQCEVSECQDGFDDCDGDGRSCEANLASDPEHCGSCEQRCAFLTESPHAVASCDAGSCQLQCQHGFADCDGRFENGCERSLSTTTDCGRCGKACAFAHGSAQCNAGRCELHACDTGYADCDSDSLSCETSLSDVPSCGACGQRCQVPHANARCSESACAVTGCDQNWSNCDNRTDNGCERDVRAVADGGEGPCAPDANCISEMFQDRQYFFCGGSRTWDSARAACKGQRNGDLAELRDAATQAFLMSHVTARVWIGHNNLVYEDTWVWADSNIPFWRGGVNGTVLGSAFVRWSQGEPNGSGRCGALTATAEMDDIACAVLQPFVCEVSPDLCPEDPKKTHPGQCGCGVADSDANNDGIAECPR